VEIVLVTGRRHAFALPIASELGFDLWIISSNGAVTRSLAGETFHRDLLPLGTARALCAQMDEFRGNLVITFDREGKGALLLEHLEELTLSIRRWLEKNMDCIEFSRPIEQALASDPLQAMFCGTIERMRQAASVLTVAPVRANITQLKTEYPVRDLCILDVLNRDCSKGHALERWATHRGIAPEEVVAIGDNHNDAEMLNFAGRAFIMENAAPELKQNGWAETGSNDACGVAQVINRVIG
jgi:Cof subfamily protein (haloacid dehalogenase superfamily)